MFTAIIFTSQKLCFRVFWIKLTFENVCTRNSFSYSMVYNGIDIIHRIASLSTEANITLSVCLSISRNTVDCKFPAQTVLSNGSWNSLHYWRIWFECKTKKVTWEKNCLFSFVSFKCKICISCEPPEQMTKFTRKLHLYLKNRQLCGEKQENGIKLKMKEGERGMQCQMAPAIPKMPPVLISQWMSLLLKSM